MQMTGNHAMLSTRHIHQKETDYRIVLPSIVFVLHEADSDGRASHTTIKNNFARTVLDGDGETATSTQEDRWPTLTTTSEIKAHRAVAKQFVEAKSLI